MTSSFTQQLDPHSVYEFGKVLGTGAFGAVYSGTHKKTGQQVAIKKLDVTDGDSDVLNETEIMSQLRSPHIIEFHGNYRAARSLFIVMELAKSDVSDLLKVHKAGVGEPFLGPIAKSAFGGLAFMHKLGYVHRDIKPGNLLISLDGRVKLSDFGVSSRRSRMHTLIGTPTFLAPEIVSGDEVGYNAKVDIWAVGITLINVAQGKPPYHDVHPMRALFLISSGPLPTLAEPAKWTPAFRQVIERTLVREQAARISADEACKLDFVANASAFLPGAKSAAAATAPDDDESSEEHLAPLADKDKQEMASWLQQQAQIEAKISGDKSIAVETLLVAAEETHAKKKHRRKGKTGSRGSKHKKSAATEPAPAAAPEIVAAPVDSLSLRERAVADEIALLRQSPAKYADIVAAERVGKYAIDNSLTLGSNCWDTKEGEKGALEAIEALRALGDKPLPAIAFADGLTRAAHAAIAVDKQRPSALSELPAFGTFTGAAQQSVVFGFDTARDIVIFLLIDDGAQERRKRKALLDPALVHAGVAVAEHETFETMCLLLFVQSWTPGKK
jgi:serine/threonine protein kinase